MKILWFTLTPCGASEKLGLNIYTNGWLSSLEKRIKKDQSIELSVCFYHNSEVAPFKYNSVSYYPIKRDRGNNKLDKFINRINSFRSKYDKSFIAKLVEIIDEVKPDVIHVHGSESNFGLIQYYTDTPVVISIQGLLNPYREKFFSGIPLKVASNNEHLISKVLLDSARNQYFLFSKWAKREAKILKIAQHIVGRTKWDRRITRILAPESKYYVGNEIMRNSFYKRKWDKQFFDNKINIVTTMSGGIFKGLESVVKTAVILTEYGFDFEWLIIGQSNNSKYQHIVKRWLKKDYKENNIILCGKKNESDLVNILCKSDIYCQVSHIENSPNSLCEAMLLGMPIVATFAGGTDSILENSKEGLLVQDGDSFSLAGTILELATDFEKSKQYGINARKTALDRHDPQKVAHEFMAIYKEINYSATKSR